MQYEEQRTPSKNRRTSFKLPKDAPQVKNKPNLKLEEGKK